MGSEKRARIDCAPGEQRLLRFTIVALHIRVFPLAAFLLTLGVHGKAG